MTPFRARISSASRVVGPFAPSTTMRALTRGAFSAVITRSKAAGTRRSQSSSRCVFPPGEILRAGGTEQSVPLPPVCHHLLQVESVRVGDRPLELGQSDQDRSGVLEELGGEVAHVAQALNHHPLAVDPRSQPERLHVFRHPADFAGPKKTPRPVASVRPRIPPALTGLAVTQPSASSSPGTKLGVGVGDPGHLPRAGAHIGCGNVESRADEILPHQLEDVAPGDPLQLPSG